MRRLEGAAWREDRRRAAKHRPSIFSNRAPSGVLEHLVPHYVNFTVYQMVLESRASEHSARMVAMKNATDNAKQLIKDLTLEYNKLRQAAHHHRTSRNHHRADGARLIRHPTLNSPTLNHMSNHGNIVQVIGPVVDVDFSASGKLPKIYKALEINFNADGMDTKLVLEVQQHLGDGWVRAVAMSSTEGLKRGMKVTATGDSDHRARRRSNARPHLQRHRRPRGRARPGERREALPDSPPRADAHRPGHEGDTSSKPASRSSTSSARSPRAARSARSVAQASARRSSSWNSSTTSPRTTAASPCSPASVSAPAKAMTFTTK